jgi:hypothetical protein
MSATTEMFFISYASNDRARVKPIWKRLQQDFPGVQFWFDDNELLPGQTWDLEIQKAKDKANGMILFLSDTSVNKEGYVQREFKWAVRRMDEMPDGHSFLFPVKLEPCEIPYTMRQWQACDLFGDDEGYQKLKKALLARLDYLRKIKTPIPSALPSLTGRRIALLATEKFPLSILEEAYRACTSRNFKRNSGSLPTYELALDQGQATALQVDPRDDRYARLDQALRLFGPDGIVVLGLGWTQAGISTPTDRRLVVPAEIHPYQVQEVTRDGVRDYELSAEPASYSPSTRALGIEPTSHHRVGAIARQMDMTLLKRQIARTDLDVIELEDARLFPLVASYGKDWTLLSAIAGPLGSDPQGMKSAAQVVSKKIMQMLGLEK